MSGREREPAPERIWIDRGPRGGWMHRHDQKLPDSEHEYVRADLMKVDPVTVEAACKAYWPAHWPQHMDKQDADSIRVHMRDAITAALRALTEAKP